MRKNTKLIPLIFAAAIILAVSYFRSFNRSTPTTPSASPPSATTARRTTSSTSDPESHQALLDAIKKHKSGVWCQSSGTIVKLLSDDREGDMHQRFLVELPGGHTIKLSHNIDLSPRVPAKEGDTVTFNGRFEWNDLGGVIHWTHRDRRGKQPGGWVELRGQRYE